MGSSGWNRPSANQPRKAPKKPSPIRGIAAGLVVVAAAAAVFFFLFSGDSGKVEIKKSEKKPTRIKEVTPAPAPKDGPKKIEKVEKLKENEEYWLGKRVVRREVVTDGVVFVESIYTEDGKKHSYLGDTVKPVFSHASDQILAMVTSDDSGTAPPLPGLGPNFENEFADSLKTEIVINDDDSEEVKAVKERVKQARKEMLEAMGAGMSANEVIAEHRRMMENNAEMRMEVVKGLKEYIEKGDTEGAQMYVEKMNQALEQMGIMKIEMPKSREEALAERQARIAERLAQQQEKKK